MKLIKGSQMAGIKIGGEIFQSYYGNLDRLKYFIDQNWNINPVYVSPPFRYNSAIKKTEYYLDRIHIDLDAHVRPFEVCFTDKSIIKEAFRTLTSVRFILSEYGIHAHIAISPSWITDIKCVRDTARKIIVGLGLKSADLQASGDMVRLHRMPNSLIKPGYYAIDITNIPDEDVKSTASMRQRFTNRAADVPLCAIDSQFKEVTLPPTLLCIPSGTSEIKPITMLFDKDCLIQQLSAPTPVPYFRWFGANYMKRKYGFDFETVMDFYRALRWDKYSEAITADQVDRVFRSSAKCPNCTTIQNYGACVTTCRWYNGH